MGRDPSGEPKISTAVDFRREITQPILALYETVAATPMPVIAIVGGDAQGFGCALASARHHDCFIADFCRLIFEAGMSF